GSGNAVLLSLPSLSVSLHSSPYRTTRGELMDRLLKRPEVERKIGHGHSRLYEMTRDGTFPTPVRIGGAVRWSEREVDDWIKARLAERTQAPRSGDSEPTGRAA